MDAPEPMLACVVLSLRNQPGLVDAVRSVVAQDEPVEIVVINSGGGGAEATLHRAGIQVPVIERQERLNPGGARNLGIAATRARYVSFLAADCMAEAGWAAARLRAHRAGALAVASAVVNADPHSVYAWAEYIVLFVRRMPGIPPEHCLLYGVSYARELFGRVGLFREDLRTGEDTEFNARVATIAPIRWVPDVRTAHRHAQQLGPLLRGQFGRGMRTAATIRMLTGTPYRLGLAAPFRMITCMRLSWRAAEPADRWRIVRAWVILPAASAAYVLGLLWSAPRRSGHPDSPGTGA